MEAPNYKCHFCNECLGTGCINELPGMGGVNNNENFQLNCLAWKKYHLDTDSFLPFHEIQQKLRLAPITGAKENIGYYSEEKFYEDFLKAAYNASLKLSIGDGYPQEKFLYGIKALQKLSEDYKTPIKAAVFLKPWENSKIFEEIEICSSFAEFIGIDIDAVDIITMKSCTSLERKTTEQLKAIQKKLTVPFVIKGIFSEQDIELVKEVKPEIVVISNHGGRVPRKNGSTADFLNHYGKTLAKYCQKIWVDGGIRTQRDIQAAIKLGAEEILLGRTCISAFCKDTEKGISQYVKSLSTSN